MRGRARTSNCIHSVNALQRVALPYCVVLLAAFLMWLAPTSAQADGAAPTLTSTPPALSNLQVVNFSWSLPGGLSADSDTVVCNIDGEGYEPCDGSTSQSYSDLDDGAHTFSVAIEHEDEDYNTTIGAAASYDFTTLTEPPYTPELDSNYPSGLGNVTIVWDDAANTTHNLKYLCKFDARKPKPCGSGSTGSITYKHPSAGDHTVLIIAVDSVGNQSAPLIVSWTQAHKQHKKPHKHRHQKQHKKSSRG